MKLNYKGRKADAQAYQGEEGRGKLRKAVTSRKQAETHGYPNGETRRKEFRHSKEGETR